MKFTMVTKAICVVHVRKILDSFTERENLTWRQTNRWCANASGGFDVAKESESSGMLRLAGINERGQVKLLIGPYWLNAFERPVTVGYMYC